MFFSLFSKLFRKDKNPSVKLPKNFRELERIINYKFKKKSLLAQALTHRSFLPSDGETGRSGSNERLEFLGDSVLNMVCGKYFFDKFEESQEGDLTRMRSMVVSGGNLSSVARNIGMGQFIQMGEFEERSGGRNKDSILEDCMEALIGAVYLDGGIKNAEKVIVGLILSKIPADLLQIRFTNYKSELLELVQSRGYPPPTYETVDAKGPEHEKTFTVNVIINEKTIAQGVSGSKKKAEQEASAKALDIISAEKNFFKDL